MTYEIYNTKRGGVLLRVVTVKYGAVYSIFRKLLYAITGSVIKLQSL